MKHLSISLLVCSFSLFISGCATPSLGEKENKDLSLDCAGRWTVEGNQKIVLNGPDLPATVINIPQYSNGWGDYTFGNNYINFRIKEYPFSLPIRPKNLLTCEKGVLYFEFISLSTRVPYRVFFVKKSL